MDLPIALQTALAESEQQFQRVLDSLGLDPAGLDRLAERIRNHKPADRSQRPLAAFSERRMPCKHRI
jgi:hypothetical protein